MRRMAGFLCLLLLCISFSCASAQDTFPPSSTPVLRGIDVSAWQGEIDWQAVAASGIEIAILRSSEGSSVIDAQFERNYADAKAAGIAVGFYHFMTASTPEEAVEQADFFLRVIEGKVPECLLALDVGADGSMSGRQLTENALAFMERVQIQSGLRIMLYTDAYAARARYGVELAKYPIWVANYGVSEPEANGKWTSWVGFQYGDTGKVPGILALVDLDSFTKEVYQSALPPTATPVPTATPAPTDMPTATPIPTCTPVPTCVPDPTNPPSNASLLCVEVREAIRLDDLAAQLNVTAQDLLSLNTVEEGVVLAGQWIRYPGTEKAVGSFSSLHVLQRDESLSTLARRYHTTTWALMTLNGFESASLPVGQVVKLPQVGRYQAFVPSWLTEHSVVVQKGDTLSSIARSYGMSMEHLATINSLQPCEHVYPGQLLRLVPYGNGSVGVFRGGYVVQKGDTLDKIARRFEVTLDALRQNNNIESKNRIYPGMVLVIPAFGD